MFEEWKCRVWHCIDHFSKMTDKLDIEKYKDLHAMLLPGPELLLREKDHASVNCLSLFLFTDYLKYGYMKSEHDPYIFLRDFLREHQKALYKCYRQLRQDKAFYFDVRPTIYRLLHVNREFCKGYHQLTDEYGCLDFPPEKLWKMLLEFAEKSDANYRKPLDKLRKYDPIIPIIHAHEEEEREEEEEETKEEVPRFPELTQFISTKSVEVPEWTEEVTDLNRRLVVKEQEDNRDNAEKQAQRSKIMRKMMGFTEQSCTLEAKSYEPDSPVIAAH